ncbi:MAG: TolC family protein, partial [Deltaproteobacteria bacterium]|nr:TolC family protein [Deltaproteobacteria bacterium]
MGTINKITSFNAVILMTVLVLLTGCLVGPDFEQPQFEDLPDEFRFSTPSDQEEVNLKWWELFNDPMLVSLVNTALNENKDLLIAISRIEEARSFLVFTKADLYPRFDLQGGANKGNFTGTLIVSDPDEPSNSAFISPVVNWEIDFWGK